VNLLTWTGLALLLFIGYLWHDHRAVLRRRTQPTETHGYGPDGDDDPGELLYEPPAGIRIHEGREGL
jgi:hypothetical protein